MHSFENVSPVSPHTGWNFKSHACAHALFAMANKAPSAHAPRVSSIASNASLFRHINQHSFAYVTFFTQIGGDSSSSHSSLHPSMKVCPSYGACFVGVAPFIFSPSSSFARYVNPGNRFIAASFSPTKARRSSGSIASARGGSIAESCKTNNLSTLLFLFLCPTSRKGKEKKGEKLRHKKRLAPKSETLYPHRFPFEGPQQNRQQKQQKKRTECPSRTSRTPPAPSCPRNSGPSATTTPRTPPPPRRS